MTRAAELTAISCHAESGVRDGGNEPTVLVCLSVGTAVMTTAMMVMSYENMAPALCMKRCNGVRRCSVRNML
jgi:uncharacterized protein (DUF983 family)